MFGMLRVEDGQPGALACPQYLAGIMTLGPISPLKPQHSPHCTWNVCSTVQRIGYNVLSVVWKLYVRCCRDNDSSLHRGRGASKP
jgi:hypothetical protein